MAYKTRNGRRIHLPLTATNGIQRLTALDGTVATFTCMSGHVMRHDYSKGPKPLRMDAASLQRMSIYWGLRVAPNGTYGRPYGWCQRCQNDADSA
jgi:hypothetical protein